jgi:hypothetical protein
VLAMEITGRYEKIFSKIYLLKDKEIEMLGDCSFIDQLVLWHNSSLLGQLSFPKFPWLVKHVSF